MTGLLPGPAEALLFATAVLVLNATPGVDLLLTVTRTLHGGWRAGAAAALGIAAGSVVHTLGAAFGLAALLALWPGTFRVIQWAGAAYLVWLGLGLLRQAWRGPPKAAAAQPAALARRPGAEFRSGLLTNVLNPKVALFFLAFLPQFVPLATPHKTLSFLLLGAWFVVQSLLFLLAVVAAAAALRQRPAPPPARRWLAGLGGLLFIALAARLALARP